jgi:DNA-directed RNA polymerase subunit K/omega
MPSTSSTSLEKVNRFERARIIGARSLQISSGAPILVPVEPEEALDPIAVAEKEFEEGVIPVTVLRAESGTTQAKRT